MILTDWNLSLEEAMDNGFRKIGVIDYQKSKYANLFIIGSFVLSISVGAIIIVNYHNYHLPFLFYHRCGYFNFINDGCLQ